jgi:hypothetical protein
MWPSGLWHCSVFHYIKQWCVQSCTTWNSHVVGMGIIDCLLQQYWNKSLPWLLSVVTFLYGCSRMYRLFHKLIYFFERHILDNFGVQMAFTVLLKTSSLWDMWFQSSTQLVVPRCKKKAVLCYLNICWHKINHLLKEIHSPLCNVLYDI